MAGYSETIISRRRLGFLTIGSILVIAAISLRLIQLQVVNHHHYLALARASQSHKYDVPATRGEIYAMDGDQMSPLVLNQTLDTLYADPKYVVNKADAASKLAAAVGGSVSDYTRLLGQNSDYVVLAKKLDDSLSNKVKALGLAGIGLQAEDYRLYPEGTLASQLLGFVNADGKGQYGIEGYFDAQLAGKPGLLDATTDVNGIPIATANNYLKPPVNGDSYVLTIDRNIQAQAEKYLDAGVQAVGAPSGSVVVIDPNTGAIKAMANYPTYDPNNFAAVTDYSVFSNDVTSGAFEPGSGFKAFTMAAALDTGKVTPTTTYNDTGSFVVDGYTIRNSENRAYGSETMDDVIQRSLNTGVMYTLRAMGGDLNNINKTGKQLFYSYLTDHFNFGIKTGVEQADESPGLVNPPTSSDVNYANMSFGQGLRVTMLQQVQGYAAIANGGTLYQPYLVQEVIHPDGSKTVTKPKVLKSHIISSQTSSELTTMLEGVVDRGTGSATKIPGYEIAGKTGTAQVPAADGNGYDPAKNIGSFTGYGPNPNPQFVMMVRINEPKTPGFAESTTVPVFGQIASWLLRYLAVAPSK